MNSRICLTVGLITLVMLGSTREVHANEGDFPEPDAGNLFLCGQHALAAEMRHQPFEALLEGARVLRGKGMCHRDPNWLTSWGVAQRQVQRDPRNCIAYYSCRGYFLYDTIDPVVREPIALAVHVALVEDPQVLRYHFDSLNAPYASWWFSPKACPNGIVYIPNSTMRFC